MRATALLAAVFVASCSSTPQHVSLPDGSAGIAVRCDRNSQSWADCYNAAGTACNGPFDIVERSSNSTWSAIANPSFGAGGSSIRRAMIVRCR